MPSDCKSKYMGGRLLGMGYLTWIMLKINASPAFIVDVTKLFTVTWETVTDYK